MRFLASGPSIPDGLLVARDEGRVIFFCGAGVSRARAALPGFFGLARQVLNTLEANVQTPTRKLLEVAERVEQEAGVGGLVPADRVFGLLERDFEVRDIQAAVAKALVPPSPPDVSAHRTLLDLATGPDGKVRLVTTNFDLLFEAADVTLKSASPPHLPDPRRHHDLEGITHLHGSVTENYSGAADDGFVLSSSEFGRAYVSDGWATKFIAALIERYVVVFVGYTADDPPVQYLLEALNRDAGSKGSIYAFQGGTSTDAESRWRHKGVRPIAYDAMADHASLWDTLSAWASRARNPEAWYQNVIDMAVRGPEALLPHERGQVMHVIGTVDGARRFASAVAIPPADWLCVLDPAVRFSKPRRVSTATEEGPSVDPFDSYGLDSDLRPAPIGADDYRSKRPIPCEAQNPLALTRLDRQDPGQNGLPAISGHWATNVPLLPDRLHQIGVWIAKVAHQPAAVWWAAGRRGLHPTIQRLIQLELDRTGKSSPPEIRRAWRLLFEAWESKQDEANTPWFQLRASIAHDGWSPAAVRRLAQVHRPYLTVDRPFFRAPKPPPVQADIALHDVITLDVEYPRIDIDVEIPDSVVVGVTREFRANVECAVALENETGVYALRQFAPIKPDPELAGNTTLRDMGISACVLFYASLFTRLAALNPGAARQEYDSWWIEDDTVFARLRIWAAADERILSAPEAGRLLSTLPDTTFWGGEHQRDLLLALQKRWETLPLDAIRIIEQRLLARPPSNNLEEPADDARHRAWISLNRIHWLRDQGCRFNFDVDAETTRLRADAPTWQPAYAASAARSMESQSGYVRTETEYNELLLTPIADLLKRATELSGRNHENFVQTDPFAGLTAARPVRAFIALVYSAKHQDFPTRAWATFLAPDVRANDKPRLACAIALRLSRLPTKTIGDLAYAISGWLEKASATLASSCPDALEAVWYALISALGESSEATESGVVRKENSDPDWVTEALNAPVGKLAQVLMHDSRLTGLKINQGLPPSWLRSVEQLFSLAGPARQHALSIFAHNLNWLYAIDPEWTLKHLVDPLDTEASDQGAIWAGYFWGGRTPARPLYGRLKASMMGLIERHAVTRHDHIGFLAVMLLSGWQRLNNPAAPKLVSDSEMRDALLNGGDEFRAQAVWYLQRWIASEQQEDGDWVQLLPELLRDVWPRHKSAKSPRTSARLCDLAFSNLQMFPRIAEIVTELVSRVSDQHLLLSHLQDDNSAIVSSYPKQTLSLLSAILPDDVSKWPYGIEKILSRLAQADPSLLKDDRLIELNAKWNSR
jgi:hypothetical protein